MVIHRNKNACNRTSAYRFYTAHVKFHQKSINKSFSLNFPVRQTAEDGSRSERCPLTMLWRTKPSEGQKSSVGCFNKTICNIHRCNWHELLLLSACVYSSKMRFIFLNFSDKCGKKVPATDFIGNRIHTFSSIVLQFTFLFWDVYQIQLLDGSPTGLKFEPCYSISYCVNFPSLLSVFPFTITPVFLYIHSLQVAAVQMAIINKCNYCESTFVY